MLHRLLELIQLAAELVDPVGLLAGGCRRSCRHRRCHCLPALFRAKSSS